MTDSVITKLPALAKLSPIEYEQTRVASAKEFDLRVSVLDSEVQKLRPEQEAQKASIVEDVEPWPDDVNGQQIAATIKATITKHCILQAHKKEAMTLWLVASYAYREFYIFPRLCLTSPTKRCGKTTTKDAISLFANRGLGCEGITPAVLYRVIEKCSPTLFLDEADTILPNNEDLRGVVNSGHHHSGNILRCVGDDHEPMAFSTFGPLCLALIGKAPDTIGDRSIGIELERKLSSQTVERIKPQDHDKHKSTRRKILKWVNDNSAALAKEPESVPNVGNDRAIDNWLPLLAVADALGGEWPAKARTAMMRIEGQPEELSDYPTMLLVDICDIAERSNWSCKVPTSTLIDALNGLEESPWPTLRNDKGISPHLLAKHLKPFDIGPKPKREGKSVFKGYDLAKIRAARQRYAPLKPSHLPDTPSQTVTQSQPSSHAGSSPLEKVTRNTTVTDANTLETTSDQHCDRVTVLEGVLERETLKTGGVL